MLIKYIIINLYTQKIRGSIFLKKFILELLNIINFFRFPMENIMSQSLKIFVFALLFCHATMSMHSARIATFLRTTRVTQKLPCNFSSYSFRKLSAHWPRVLGVALSAAAREYWERVKKEEKEIANLSWDKLRERINFSVSQSYPDQ